MSIRSNDEQAGALVVRSYQDGDHEQVTRLYDEGLLAGQIAPNDSGADLDYIREAYFDNDRHHFWVAENQGRCVGMIGVASDEDHTAEIRRLRVAKDLQGTGIAAQLLETAISHCKHHGYLKIRLDTRFEKDEAVDLFDPCRLPAHSDPPHAGQKKRLSSTSIFTARKTTRMAERDDLIWRHQLLLPD